MNSLPLMGIGNRPPVPERYAGPSAHYPSWGSETGQVSHGGTRLPELITPHGDRKQHPEAPIILDSEGSLPLMGIGNAGLDCQRHQPCAGLITPHGDRKPTDRSRKDLPASTSLPLMGIGNCPGNIRELAERKLITPHGDRKPAAEHRHLHGERPLITPHGDRKPGSFRSGSDGRHDASHYPSWGSETSLDCQRHQPCAGLITPHGDRKRPAVSLYSAYYPPSLPLMGIGNSCRVRSVHAPRRLLITPHGDRKPPGRIV